MTQTTQKKRGLGRSLDMLLKPQVSSALPESPKPLANIVQTSGLTELGIERLTPSKYQPRKVMDDTLIDELAASIKKHGVIQPIVCVRNEDGFEIIAGERRWRASQRAGLQTVPVVIRDFSEEERHAVALIENIQREDLNALEVAEGVYQLIKEHQFSHQQAADVLGKSRSQISNLLRLLELTPFVKERLLAGDIDMGHARALLGLMPSEQDESCRLVIEKNLTVRETEKLIKNWGKQLFVEPEEITPCVDVSRLEKNISERLGADIAIKHRKNGKGRLVISYNSLDELDGIVEHLHK